MKVAYLSIQTREKDIGWTGEPEMSYAGLCLEDFEPFCFESQKVVIYDRDHVSELIGSVKHANLVVCFSTYCFDVLDKYYDSDYPMYYDFAIFDILDMVLGELEHKVYLETVANSLNMQRKVSTGAAAVFLWNSGKTEELKQVIDQDIQILKRAFEKIATSKKWELIDPRTGDKLVLDISRWGKVAFDLAKDSFYDKVNIAVRKEPNF